MSDVNAVCLTGRLTRDPEARATAGGTSVLEFGLAVGERRKNQQTGQWEDYTNYVDCTLFGNRADSLGRILAKGMPVTVLGRLRWESWEKNGERRSKIKVIVGELVLPPKRDGGGDGSAQAATGPYEDEIPF